MKLALRIFAVAIGGAVASLIALILWWNSGERERIHDAAISSAHLASIPDPNYQAKTRGGMFSRTYWIVFTCTDEQFDKFISSSAGLRDVIPYIFPFAENQPTPTTWDKPPEYTREAMRQATSFWDVQPDTSPFWNPSPTRKKGRRYEIEIPDEAIHGFLLRDDESGEVFLRVSYS